MIEIRQAQGEKVKTVWVSRRLQLHQLKTVECYKDTY